MPVPLPRRPPRQPQIQEQQVQMLELRGKWGDDRLGDEIPECRIQGGVRVAKQTLSKPFALRRLRSPIAPLPTGNCPLWGEHNVLTINNNTTAKTLLCSSLPIEGEG